MPRGWDGERGADHRNSKMPSNDEAPQISPRGSTSSRTHAHIFASTAFASVLAGSSFLSPVGAADGATAVGLFAVVGGGVATGDGAGAAAGVVVG